MKGATRGCVTNSSGQPDTDGRFDEGAFMSDADILTKARRLG